MPENNDDEIMLLLAVVLSNQALIMSALAVLPNTPKTFTNSLLKGGEISLKKGKMIEDRIREKHGLKPPVQSVQ